MIGKSNLSMCLSVLFYSIISAIVVVWAIIPLPVNAQIIRHMSLNLMERALETFETSDIRIESMSSSIYRYALWRRLSPYQTHRFPGYWRHHQISQFNTSWRTRSSSLNLVYRNKLSNYHSWSFQLLDEAGNSYFSIYLP